MIQTLQEIERRINNGELDDILSTELAIINELADLIDEATGDPTERLQIAVALGIMYREVHSLAPS